MTQRYLEAEGKAYQKLTTLHKKSNWCNYFYYINQLIFVCCILGQYTVGSGESFWSFIRSFIHAVDAWHFICSARSKIYCPRLWIKFSLGCILHEVKHWSKRSSDIGCWSNMSAWQTFVIFINFFLYRHLWGYCLNWIVYSFGDVMLSIIANHKSRHFVVSNITLIVIESVARTLSAAVLYEVGRWVRHTISF